MDLEQSINDVCKELKKTYKNTKKSASAAKSAAKNTPGEKIGAKNKGYTPEHRDEINRYRRTLVATPAGININNEIIERVQGDIVADDDLQAFQELYKLTIDTVLAQFKENNADLVKKHPYLWYKPFLIELKKACPAVTYKDIDKLFIVWDELSEVLSKIGLYITYETFQLFTKVYDYQLKSMEKVNPKYVELRKKINIERDNALINEIAYNSYASTNKIFLAKCHGIIEQTKPKTIEITHNVRNYDNISRYRLEAGSGSDIE